MAGRFWVEDLGCRVWGIMGLELGFKDAFSDRWNIVFEKKERRDAARTIVPSLWYVADLPSRAIAKQ